MQIESSNNPKGKYFSNSLKIEDENINCKDGFCPLPIKNENQSTKNNKVNLFDPI